MGDGAFGIVHESADGKFAIKKPFTDHQESFKNEIEILKYINAKNNKHLMNLIDFNDVEVCKLSIIELIKYRESFRVPCFIQCQNAIKHLVCNLNKIFIKIFLKIFY